METLAYENWVQQTCKFNFDVTIKSASGSESVNLPQIQVLGRSISVAGVSLMLGVSVQMSLGLSASLLFTGTDAVNAKAEAQQMVKIGCKDRCQIYSGSPDIIFERSFVSSNSDNFKAVTGISGALEPSVSLSLSAGIMGNFGSMGDWGFKIYGVVKLSLPITIRTGYYLSAISNPNRFFIGGSIAACSQKHSLDFQAIMKVDLLFVDVTIAVYWKTVTRLIQPQNLVTFDLILFCHGEECAPGKSPGSGDICVSCSAGTYKTSTGSAACTFCPSGKYSAAVGQTSETTCSACQANSNSPAGSDAATDCACNAGFTGTNGGTCAICVAGKYKGGIGNLACLDCGVGKYSTATGQTAESTCIYCLAGKYSGAVAQTAESSCLVCPSNSHAPAGSGSASNCVCNAGFAGSTGGTCGVCAAAKYKAGTGNVACSDCEAGKHKATQGINTACNNCEAGKYKATAGATACDACVAGKYKATTGVNADCDICVAGKHKATQGINTACDDCEAGKYKDTAGATACDACIAGKYKSTAGVNTDCDDCEAGKYKATAGATACDACVAGKYKSTAGVNLVCDICVAGKYKAASGVNLVCDMCDPGKYKAMAGVNTACDICPAGKYKATQGVNTECDSCATNSNSPAGSGSALECVCNVGYTGFAGGQCVGCVAGKYKPDTGSLACSDCGPGKYSTATGQMFESTCSLCTANANAPAGSVVRSQCTCNSGFSGPNGGECLGCVAGKYKAGTGSAVCTDCGPGKYSASNWQTSESSCLQCTPNSHSAAGSDGPTDCACLPGYTSNGGGACTGCLPGKYKARTDNSACDDCTGGKYSAATAQVAESACSACLANSYAPVGSNTATDCLCNIGSTGDDGGACVKCEPGKYKVRISHSARPPLSSFPSLRTALY